VFDERAKTTLAKTLVLLACSMISVTQALARQPEKEESEREEPLDLRAVFYDAEDSAASGMVASLSIMLIEPSGSREVRLDHPFHSGDRFRFVVSSNRDGWLYILHRSPTGTVQQLWPQRDPQKGSPRHQEVEAGESYLIPPHPGAFVFDEEVGQEEFIVAICSEQTAPNLSLLDAPVPGLSPSTGIQSPIGAADAVAAASSPRRKTTGNIVIRDVFSGGTTRGIYFDPGTDDSDPRLYFSTAGADGATKAMLRFRLRHEK